MNKNIIFNIFMMFNLLFVEISSYSDGVTNFDKINDDSSKIKESNFELLIQEIRELRTDSKKSLKSIDEAFVNFESSNTSLDKILKYQDATEAALLNRVTEIEKTLHGIERKHIEILSSILKVKSSKLKPFLLGSAAAAYLVYEYREIIDSYMSKLNEKLEAVKKQV